VLLGLNSMLLTRSPPWLMLIVGPHTRMGVDTRVPLKFGRAIAKGDYVAAHALLTRRAQESHPPEALISELMRYCSGREVT
jgi:hypothetical protein